MFRVVICNLVYEQFEQFSKVFICFWDTLLRLVREDAITLEQIESKSWIELNIHGKIHRLHYYNLRDLARRAKIIDKQGTVDRHAKEPTFEIVETAFTQKHTSSLFN
ncbi:MAG: hypothetical protein HZA35_00950 [Parcubacteria group bacterium]|nr:hypothetical protein [Parcubacteria group bacterium]